jgi:endonuclease/exonuclease/phosphatase family metal-dependent hydrolase
MPRLRICTINAEWMNDWFTADAGPAAFRPSFTRDGQINDTQRTAARLAALIGEIDADVLALQEAPSRSAELDLFVDTYLVDNGVARYAYLRGDSGGAQKLALLYKPAAVDSAILTPHEAIGMLLDPWEADVDGDGFLDLYQFTRQPLIVNLEIGGHFLQVIVMHTKSNFVNQGKAMWENPATRQNYIVGALKNRRRIAAEGMRVRKYVEARLDADAGARIVILGDLNDGPGMDLFEEKYLSHSVTDILVGSSFEPEWQFDHTQHDVPRDRRYTAVFDDFVTGTQGKRILLDHVLLSPGLLGDQGLRKVPGSGWIHHLERDVHTQPPESLRENRPTDHRPASVLLEY